MPFVCALSFKSMGEMPFVFHLINLYLERIELKNNRAAAAAAVAAAIAVD